MMEVVRVNICLHGRYFRKSKYNYRLTSRQHSLERRSICTFAHCTLLKMHICHLFRKRPDLKQVTSRLFSSRATSAKFVTMVGTSPFDGALPPG